VLAIVAGSDTTTVTLSNVFYYLMTDRKSYKRLQEEVDRCFPPGEDVLNSKHFVDMPYLDAVVYVEIPCFCSIVAI
jgi:cytochrome P450